MERERSCGQQLLHDRKVSQGSCFLASSIPMEKRLQWTDSFTKSQFRNDAKKVKDSSIFLILSQNCDIACRQDNIDSTLEIAVCKSIKEKNVFAGNSFVKSVRKLHFKANDNWYEANVDYILHVDKCDLHETISGLNEFELITLAEDFRKSVPVWRANRYLRSALPDNFNVKFEPVLSQYIERLEALGKTVNNKPFSSYIRALYVWVNSFDELDTYSFEFFALLRDETENELLSDIQDLIEDMCIALSESAKYDDKSDVYAGTESTVSVGYLTKLVRLNLDSHSLRKGDGDLGPDGI